MSEKGERVERVGFTLDSYWYEVFAAIGGLVMLYVALVTRGGDLSLAITAGALVLVSLDYALARRRNRRLEDRSG